MSWLSSALGALSNSNSDDNGCDWYCDNCGAYMNNQAGFTTANDVWTCSNCAVDNDVSENNIRYDGSEWDDNDESLSIDEAAQIWLSNGKDEDYMFGYTEEELEGAL